MATLYVFTQYIEPSPSQPLVKNKTPFIIFILLLCFSFFVRSAGIVLIASSLFYLLFIRREFKVAVCILFAFVATFLIQNLITGFHTGSFQYAASDPQAFLTNIIKNFSVSMRSTLMLFIPGATHFSKSILSLADRGILLLAPAILLLVIIVSTVKIIHRRISFIGTFTLLYFLLLVFWSGFADKPNTFGRFIYPFAGPLLIILVESLLNLGKKVLWLEKKNQIMNHIAQVLLILIIFINLHSVVVKYNFNDDVLYQKENQELFNWVKGNLEEDEHYMFWKSRPMVLMTGRVGTSPWNKDPKSQELFFKRIHDLKISYLILIKPLDTLFIQQIESMQGFSHLVWENKNYKIFKVNKSVL